MTVEVKVWVVREAGSEFVDREQDQPPGSEASQDDDDLGTAAEN